jgi:iron complex outermembrane receptor protein
MPSDNKSKQQKTINEESDLKPNFTHKPMALALSVALAQLMTLPAHAQEKAKTEASGAIEEVVVTAQKRKENLQDVPISIQAMGAKELEKKNIVTLSDLGAEIPGLNLAPYPGSSEAFFPTFRGITTNAVFISAPNPLAFHVDGVFRSQLMGLNNPAGDLERIEVLKGPQGVLSGRNATGGAVNVYTARPELGLDHIGLKQQFSFANRGQFLSRTVVNIPVNDDLAMKVSYLHREKDNDGVRNSAPGGVQFGELKSDAWRFDVRWKPQNNITVDYGYDNTNTKSYDTPPQCIVPGYSLGAGFSTSPDLATFIAGCSFNKLDQLYVSTPYEKNKNKTEGHTLNVTWDVSPTFTLRSITGYTKLDTSNHYNYGAYAGGDAFRADSFTYTGGLGHPIVLYNTAWSQEFQFLGEIAKNLNYTAGLFYSSEDGYQHSGPNIGMLMPDIPLPPTYTPATLLLTDEKGLSSAKSKSWAAFAQMTWTPEILDNKLDIVPGIRFTRDHRKVVGYNTGWGYIDDITTPFGFSSAEGNKSWSKSTPAISFNYHWQKDLMTYVKYSTAYTSGGFDPIAGPGNGAAAFAQGFEPETIKSYEAGMKGEFFERRLRANVAVFQSKFTNEQKSTAQLSGGWQTVNVGRSTYNGLELNLTAAITRALRLGVNYAYLSHKYNQWIDPVSGLDVTRNRDLIVPKNDYSVNLDYRFPDFGLPGKLDLSVNYTHRDATSTPVDTSKVFPTLADPRTALTTPAFSIWNARLALSQIKAGPGDEGRVTVGLFGKNLTNKKYLTMTNPGWVTDMSGNWGEPRTVGVDLTYVY